jgi:hypothetical protein
MAIDEERIQYLGRDMLTLEGVDQDEFERDFPADLNRLPERTHTHGPRRGSTGKRRGEFRAKMAPKKKRYS